MQWAIKTLLFALLEAELMRERSIVFFQFPQLSTLKIKYTF